MSAGSRRTPTLALFHLQPSHHTYNKMPDFDMLPPRTARRKKMSILVILSYAFDWLIMVAVGLVGYFLGNVTPNKRPFSLLDNNIAYVRLRSPSSQLWQPLGDVYSSTRCLCSSPWRRRQLTMMKSAQLSRDRA